MEKPANIPTLENLRLLEREEKEDLTEGEVKGLQQAYDLKGDKGKGEELSEDFVKSICDPYSVGQVAPLDQEGYATSGEWWKW